MARKQPNVIHLQQHKCNPVALPTRWEVKPSNHPEFIARVWDGESYDLDNFPETRTSSTSSPGALRSYYCSSISTSTNSLIPFSLMYFSLLSVFRQAIVFRSDCPLSDQNALSESGRPRSPQRWFADYQRLLHACLGRNASSGLHVRKSSDSRALLEINRRFGK
jgi:hypothetical protein